MRQKLNENPKYQLALLGVLAVFGAFFLSTRVLGGAETETAPAGTEVTPGVAAPAGDPAAVAAAPTAAPPVPAPPLPPRVFDAYQRGDTIALLIVRAGGFDDRKVARAVRALGPTPGVTPIVATADEIARYASITQSAGVDRVPALVVVTPDGQTGQAGATVQYGFKSEQSIVQAVKDAVYDGPIVGYAPS